MHWPKYSNANKANRLLSFQCFTNKSKTANKRREGVAKKNSQVHTSKCFEVYCQAGIWSLDPIKSCPSMLSASYFFEIPFNTRSIIFFGIVCSYTCLEKFETPRQQRSLTVSKPQHNQTPLPRKVLLGIQKPGIGTDRSRELFTVLFHFSKGVDSPFSPKKITPNSSQQPIGTIRGGGDSCAHIDGPCFDEFGGGDRENFS